MTRLRLPCRDLLRPSGAQGRERGSTVLETAIVTPLLLAVLMMTIGAGRVAMAHNTVDNAAWAAARAASIERTSGAASSAARAMAAAHLDEKGLQCSSQTVHVNTAGFSSPPGTHASVSVSVACTVPLGDLSVPGLGGSRTITSNLATSSIDTYRGRG